jgi:ABC-2 type transport system ATP-binding protein
MVSVIVEAQNIEKSFIIDRPLYKQILAPFATRQKIWALKGVSFSIKSGEILGIVGPNGAGKTTLLRILANLLEADGGCIRLCGHELNGQCHLRTDIGYVSNDERSFFWRLSGIQNLEFFARLYGINKVEARKRITKLLGLFALEGIANRLFRDYSTGTRKKYVLVRALIHQPRILLLDEVTNSLDSISAQNVKSLVREYVSNKHGCSGVWSTHRFEEIFEICDKILIISKGQVKFFGTASDLRAKYGREAFHFIDGNFVE